MDQSLRKEPIAYTPELMDYTPRFGDYCIIGSPKVYNINQDPPPEYRIEQKQKIVPPQ